MRGNKVRNFIEQPIINSIDGVSLLPLGLLAWKDPVEHQHCQHATISEPVI
jgi:hypothetical protein